MSRALGPAAVLVLGASFLAPVTTPAAPGPIARVTYVTARSVYVDAGSESGLTPGSKLELYDGDSLLGTLTVSESTPHRALCRRDVDDLAVAVGATVRLASSGGAVVDDGEEQDSEGDSDRRSERRGRRGEPRGRVGVHFLSVSDRLRDGNDFDEPGISLRLIAPRIGGSDFGFAADVRARRTSRGRGDDESATRVYRFAASWNPAGSPWRVTAGRQFSPALANVALFDGFLGEYVGERWQAGLFSGAEPDAEDFGFTSDTNTHGGYFGVSGRTDGEGSWSINTGLVGSYDGGEINREFVYVQGHFTGRRVTSYVVQEVDVNRDWKKDEAGESTLDPTSTFAFVRIRASEWLGLNAGYDNRRNVRLLRDRETPVTEFDDEFRRRIWLGADVRAGKRVRLSGEYGTSTDDDDGDADTFTGSFALTGMTSLDLDLRLRSARYEETETEGWFHAASVGAYVGRSWYLAISGGLRDEEILFASTTIDDSLVWFGFDVDLMLKSGWFAQLSYETVDGDGEDYDQIFTSLSWRF